MNIFKPFVLGMCVLFISCNQQGHILTADYFENDAHGWNVVGDANGDSATPLYASKNGVNNGYIYAKDEATGGVWYFAAPETYLGNQQDFYGADLKFSLYQESQMDNQFDDKDIILKSGSDQIYHSIKPYPDSTWTHYTIPLKENSGWFSVDGKEVGEQKIKAILNNLTEFWIRGEYQSGADTGGLDQVEIVKK